MTGALADAVVVVNVTVLVYYLTLNVGYVVMIATAAVEFVQDARRGRSAGFDEMFANPLMPGVSVIMPAHNEEPTIVDAVRSMLALRYPHVEIIVVDDGSTDRTFEVLATAFDLVETTKMPIAEHVEIQGRVRSVHVSANGDPVVVLRKDSVGRRSDSVNAGVRYARLELLCMVDADVILEEMALLRVAKPFVDDPDRVVASGGVIRAANGCVIERGSVTEARVPRNWLVRIQVIEYLRAFLIGRTAWSRAGALLSISGAFGLFRRDLVQELGGLDPESMGEDLELVARIHRTMRERGQPYRVVFVPEPVCWTEVPETLAVLGRQRRRWSTGLVQTMARHQRMIGNPRYGRIGTVTMPYFVVFEMLSPIVEVGGVAILVLSLALGVVNAQFAVLFAIVAVLFGAFVSIGAIALEEATYRRYRRGRDIAALVVAAVIENLGYRQLHAWWRLHGMLPRRGEASEWGDMQRRGFAGEPPSPARQFSSSIR